MNYPKEINLSKERTFDSKKVKKKWVEYKLPEDMSGSSFLEIGCWSGGFCVEAKRRGAKNVLGIDMSRSPMISFFQKENYFDFILCDVFSEKYLELPRFDIVYCAGVLYHVEDVISFINRLKIKTIGKLILETEVMSDNEPQDIPFLRFYPRDELDNNYSNWWVPNMLCMDEILKSCEFEEVKVVSKSIKRACFHAVPKNEICKKILPRHVNLIDNANNE